jgi:hypothetical protein
MRFPSRTCRPQLEQLEDRRTPSAGLHPNLSSLAAPPGGHAGAGQHAVQQMRTVAPSITISDASGSGGCNPSVPCDPLPPPEDWVTA